MSEKNELTLNRLPSITWYWLKMNESRVQVPAQLAEGGLESVFPSEEVTESDIPDPVLAEQPTGSGPQVGALLRQIKTRTFTAQAGKKAETPVRLRFPFADGDQKAYAVQLVTEENSQMTVLMDYTSKAVGQKAEDTRIEAADAPAGFGAVQTKVHVGKNSVLRLVQTIRVGSGFTFINDIGGRCDDGGRIEIIHLFLGGGDVYQGCQIDLAGDKSSLKTDIAYQVLGNSHLDMNYFANHTGKKTECAINANGVLRDHAKKTFRGTIDFKRGASGSVGNEMEDVLMMDDDVQNQTIPLILCAEEDVVGNHGATIGRLDEGLMFYLETRGMNQEQIYEMMAKARMDSVIRLIPDNSMKDEINTWLGGTADDNE
jgi:Fe-S cluster assembly scaffold protein SufB